MRVIAKTEKLSRDGELFCCVTASLIAQPNSVPSLPIYLGGAGVNISRLLGSGFGLGFGAFFASFLPLSLLPMQK
jgi:hypothetical protein